MYIELHTSSAFSFLDGASLPERLVERAAELGYPALAMLDRDGVQGIPRFHLAAKRAGIKAIVGAELSLAVGSRPLTVGADARLLTLPVLVASRQGYRNLCRLVTTMKLRAPKGEGALTPEDLDGQVGGLTALVGRAAINGPRFGVGGLMDRLVGLFGAPNVCVELQRHLLRDEESDNQALLDLASAFHLPVIATNGVRFAEPSDRPLYDVLTCIRHKTTLARAGRRLTWNAERYLKPPEAMARLFSDLPAAIAGTRELADRLEYTMADLGYRFPEYPVPPGETMASFLRKITQAGARERYRPYHDRARAQVERELNLIEKLDLAGYFLIVWDIVNFCRQQDILVQGRGSAANSAVCYSLGITAVDPVGMDLLFERFLSEERGEWPDIDLDLPSGDRRERVIQHVYQKYGRHGAAMTANVITYRGRSAAREVGKALAIEPAQIDRLAKVMNHFEWVDPKETLERNMRDVGIDFHDPTIQLFGQLWQRIQDLPRHLGQHSGGMVVCQGRLDEVVPLENASMPDRVVIQWDKDDCADMGIVKVDLLGLGMMSVIQDALAMVNSVAAAPAAGPEGESSSPEGPASGGGAPRAEREDALALVDARSGLGARGSGFGSQSGANHEPDNLDARAPSPEPRAPVELDLAHLPPGDPAVYRMLQEADTVGIFQVESRAQMATLPRLRPARFYDIVVEVAIIRPGPIVGQMVHPYLKRRQGAEAVDYPHPSLEPILARTLGVPLFQEQLLRMAMVAAGFSGGEAEELRRAFGFKRSEKRMQQIEGKLRAGMARQGITGDAAEGIIRSITSFALYGFPESHAASFALLVYASAYLKAHYPAAFYTAMLNNQPMGFYHPATLVKDAQRHGVRFAPIDVQESDWECRVDPDGRVRLGLMYVNGLRAEVGKAIAALRAEQPDAPDAGGQAGPATPQASPDRCPKCGCDDESMLERTPSDAFFCNICAHQWSGAARGTSAAAPPSAVRSSTGLPPIEAEGGEAPDDGRRVVDNGSWTAEGPPSPGLRRGPAEAGQNPWQAEADGRRRYASLETLIAHTGLRRDELATLAEIGALNAFCHDRRTALWQIERAVRPSGELFESLGSWSLVPGSLVPGSLGPESLGPEALGPQSLIPGPGSRVHLSKDAGTKDQGPKDQGPKDQGPKDQGPKDQGPKDQGPKSPLRAMTPAERVMADYAGTSLTIGPHPMALRRAELALRGVLRARDLSQGQHGRRVRVAGAVITRQRPGTAKGFVFLTLEDETGIANIIVRPDLFADQKATIVGEAYLLVEGILQIQEGVTSVKAHRVLPLIGEGPEPESHDFR